VCLPTTSDQPSSAARPAHGFGPPMPLASPGGPVAAGALAGPAPGAPLGSGGVTLALASCAAVPAATPAWSRHATRHAPTPDPPGWP
jgi:hypothetical protein